MTQLHKEQELRDGSIRLDDRGVWLSGEANGRTELSGYVLSVPFTVCWFGALDPPKKLAPILDQAGALFSTVAKQGPAVALFRYGAEKADPIRIQPNQPLDGFFTDHLDERFSFYRLELSAPGAYCAVWMDFSDPEREPDENIGISLSLTLLNHQAKGLVRRAVKLTRPSAETAVSDLFNKIRDEVGLTAR